jgi:hypothetical protein
MGEVADEGEQGAGNVEGFGRRDVEGAVFAKRRQGVVGKS